MRAFTTHYTNPPLGLKMTRPINTRYQMPKHDIYDTASPLAHDVSNKVKENI